MDQVISPDATEAIKAAEAIIQEAGLHECLNCRKQFKGKGNYCPSCEQLWETTELPAIEREAAAQRLHQIRQWREKGTLCIRCEQAEKNGHHPFCRTCYQTYQANQAECAEDGCTNKVANGFDRCRNCNRKVKLQQELGPEARYYHQLGLKGTNGLPATVEYIIEHIEYFRQQAKTRPNQAPCNQPTTGSQDRARQEAARRERQLARSVNPNKGINNAGNTNGKKKKK